jgi:hypothetical protein
MAKIKMDEAKLVGELGRWLVFLFIAMIMPLFSMVIHLSANNSARDGYRGIPEIIAFVFLVCFMTIADILSVARIKGWTSTTSIMLTFQIICLSVSALLLGFGWCTGLNPCVNPNIYTLLLTHTIALLSGIISTGFQVWIIKDRALL